LSMRMKTGMEAWYIDSDIGGMTPEKRESGGR